MTTKTDNRKLSSFYYYAVFLSLANAGNGFLITKSLKFFDNVNTRPNKYNPNWIPVIMFACSAVFGFYKIQSLKSKLDEKYTPLWLKSSGSALN